MWGFPFLAASPAGEGAKDADSQTEPEPGSSSFFQEALDAAGGELAGWLPTGEAAVIARLKRLEQHFTHRFERQAEMINALSSGLDEFHSTLARFRSSINLLNDTAKLMPGFQQALLGSGAGSSGDAAGPTTAAECQDMMCRLQDTHMQAMYDREVPQAAAPGAASIDMCNDLLAHQYVHGMQLKAVQAQLRELQDSLLPTARCYTAGPPQEGASPRLSTQASASAICSAGAMPPSPPQPSEGSIATTSVTPTSVDAEASTASGGSISPAPAPSARLEARVSRLEALISGAGGA